MIWLGAAFAAELRLSGLGEPGFAPCVTPPREEPAAPPPVRPMSERLAGWAIYGAGGDSALDRVAAAPGGLHDEPLRGDAGQLARLRALFALRRKAPLRVAVGGDSHTGWDGLPGQIRRVLQARYGDAGAGFLSGGGFPGGAGRAERCEQGWKLTVSGRGPGTAPAGALLSSADPAALFAINVEDEARAGAETRFRVLYDAGAGGLVARVDQGAPTPLPRGSGFQLLDLVVPLGPHRLELRPAGDGTARLAGVFVEREPLRRPGVVVDGLGLGGRSLASVADWDAASARALAGVRPYDLVIWAGGSADARRDLEEAGFRADTRAALGRLRESWPEAACVVLGPADRGSPVEGGVISWEAHAWMNRVIREEAAALGCLSWDLQALMGGPGSAVAWRDAGLMARDLLHLTPAGYRLVGQRLVELIDPR